MEMNKSGKRFFNFIIGFLILIGFYFLSFYILKLLHIAFPPAILGLILFSFALIEGIIKESWIKDTCEFLINNMAMFLVPFIGGLIVYKSLLIKNWLVILVVIFISTTVIIAVTGLFTEWGIKFLRLNKIKTVNKNKGLNHD